MSKKLVAYFSASGVTAQLAKTLGISRPTLDKLIRQHTTA